MSSDIVERLRLLAATYPLWGEVKTRSNQAAYEIERLRAERDASRLMISDLTAEAERLRAAGDALAEVSLGARPWITPLFAMEHGNRISAATAAWQEARRG